MTNGSHIHSLLFAVILFVLCVNCRSSSYNLLDPVRYVHADLIAAEGRDEVERNYDPSDDEDGVAAYDPVLADKRSISLGNLFFPGAADVAAAKQGKRANGGIGNTKAQRIGNNLFRASIDMEQEPSNGKNNTDEGLKKHDNKHGTEDTNHKGPKIWDQWGKWSSCSVSCGIGKLTRWRHCVSGGCAAGEKEAQIKTCTMPAC